MALKQELVLIPNLTVLAVQCGIFLVNIVVVKKLFIDPYLTVLDRRSKITTGSKDDAGRFLAEAEVLSQKVNDRLQQTYERAKIERQKTRDAAIAKRDQVVSTAEKTARAEIDAVQKQVASDLTQEKTKIPTVVSQLTDEVYRIALA